MMPRVQHTQQQRRPWLQLAFDFDRLDADPPEPETDDLDELPSLLTGENPVESEGGEL